MAYYDSIARQWHKATGYQGGDFKRLVLNDILLENVPDTEGQSILELGAGNGYFMPLLLRKHSGRQPARAVVTDQSPKLLEIARKHFPIPQAEYKVLNVTKKFPFPDQTFDTILATMIFNEVSTVALKRALAECHRVLAEAGVLLITVSHPDFIHSLQKRGQLKRDKGGTLTMPGAGTLRLPVVTRKADAYRQALGESGFAYQEQDMRPTPELLRAKPGLRHNPKTPIALLFRCTK